MSTKKAKFWLIKETLRMPKNDFTEIENSCSRSKGSSNHSLKKDQEKDI